MHLQLRIPLEGQTYAEHYADRNEYSRDCAPHARDHRQAERACALPRRRTRSAKQREHQEYRADDEDEGSVGHVGLNDVVGDMYGA